MVTLDMVREALGAAEPNYQQLAEEFGVDAIPYIRQLVESNDERIAIRAVHLAAALGDVWSVKTAASRPSAYVRIAAIGAATDLKPSEAAPILAQLQVDDHSKVNSVAALTLTRFPEIDQIVRSSRPLDP